MIKEVEAWMMARKYMIMALLTILLIAPLIFPRTLASPEKLRVDPAYVEKNPGDTVEVKVIIEDVEDMGGFEFKLLWNATILECIGVNITLPPTWNITEGTALVNANVTDNEIGQYHVSVAYLPPAEPFTGNQTLVTLTFKAWEPGTTLLELEDVTIVDSLENPISVNEEEGTVTVLARPPIIPCRLYVEPESIIAPEMKPSSIFTINITVANVTDLVLLKLLE